jgi:hypothetical protein
MPRQKVTAKAKRMEKPMVTKKETVMEREKAKPTPMAKESAKQCESAMGSVVALELG